ncbi:MAG TPA: hypothetical protein VEI82_10785 [Myxococcota bacterium]|nr:hypothetical protein [Myxococcota bacterium]
MHPRPAPAPVLLLALALALGACAHSPVPAATAIPGLAGAAHIYTLTDLHPDEKHARLYAANFMDKGLIPVCSEVTLLGYQDGRMTFRVNATEKEYEYLDHDVSGEPFPQHLARYFGPECPRAEIDQLTDSERDAVRLGTVAIGMRRSAVILAMGYPPHRDTPSLALPRWLYWHSRFNSFAIEFDADGEVARFYE